MLFITSPGVSDTVWPDEGSPSVITRALTQSLTQSIGQLNHGNVNNHAYNKKKLKTQKIPEQTNDTLSAGQYTDVYECYRPDGLGWVHKCGKAQKLD